MVKKYLSTDRILSRLRDVVLLDYPGIKQRKLVGLQNRAKNMLSVVDAIAHQTAAKNPEDFIERFSERIQALSANQDLLVRNEWNGVEIKDLVHAQLAHL